ncbi:MAG: D-alanyl-D-alanine carboxypeptidase [Mogibacterium sp.]|nr:D-alanyl-D-alanine carboxypeptidase [Mogibacterium sp.]
MKANLFHNGKRIKAALISALLIIALSVSMVLGSFNPAFAYDAVKTSEVAPSITAQAAVVYSEDLDKVIFAKNETARMNPYSITKLMTAYVVVDNLPLDKQITIGDTYEGEDESSMKLEKGEVLTVEQLLQGLLVASGNDAARALAVAVAGSESAFAEMMNKQAADWGCTGTHFTNASGMQDANHYTTAADFLIISREAMNNETIREITRIEKVVIPATNKSKQREYKNHTTLYSEEGSGILGGKTGFWDENDCSVALQYRKKDLSLTMVILGDTKKGRIEDIKILAAAAHQTVPGFVVAKPSETVKHMWIKGGKKTFIPVYVTTSAYAYPADGTDKSIKVECTLKKGIKAPLKKGQIVGTCKVYADGKLKATRTLVVRKAVAKGWFPSMFYISNAASVVILVLVLALVAVIVLMKRKPKGGKPKSKTDTDTLE